MKKEYVSPNLYVLKIDIEWALLTGSAVKKVATVDALTEDDEYDW